MRPITDRTTDEEHRLLASADDRSGPTASPLVPGDIHREHARSPLGRFVMPPVPGGDVRPLLGEAMADGASDTTGPAGDQGNLVV